jgi:hypothetical protein
MTAEVAILNKSAVALAADSAVTISAGSDQQKTYDSADKLFELSLCDPIGVMVNGDMNFMQIPIAVLVKKYRDDCPKFDRVTSAAEAFLRYLAEWGTQAPAAIKSTYIIMAIRPWLERAKERANDAFLNRIFNVENNGGDDFRKKVEDLRLSLLKEQIEVLRSALSRVPDAMFVGEGEFSLSQIDIDTVASYISDVFDDTNDDIKTAILDVCQLILVKKGTGPTHTGVIVAGFGKDDLFPTLVPYEVYGVVGDRLKYWKSDEVDIDRSGDKAKVIPFAQKEMVERFLYGLDEGIRRNVASFCRTAVPNIRKKILEKLEMSEEDEASLTRDAEEAEKAFFDGLTNDSFEAIRQQSQEEIEDMVEFMPKPEMARMAEALVNLTSIKRRVSRGMETVGGPIDVAVISRSEGFVWVKRKHYFPAELNSRFFERKRAERIMEG